MDPELLGFPSSDEFRTIIASAIDGFLVVNTSGRILEVNDSYCQLVGYSRSELLNLNISDINAVDSQEDVANRIKILLQSGSMRFETKHRHKNGAIIDMEVSTNYSPSNGGTLFFFCRDITDQKRTREIMAARLRLMEYSLSHSLQELLRKTLDEVEAMTGSCIGFYHFLEADHQALALQERSPRTANVFCKAGGAGINDGISPAGVWFDCVRERSAVIHNDYSSLPNRKGMPEGHAPVVRELVVPIFRNERIVAILGVGNKATDYDQQDVETTILLADLSWSVVERKFYEIALLQSEERYRDIVENQVELVDRYLPGGILTYVNQALTTFAGVPEEELLGKSFYSFIHEADQEEIQRQIESISPANPTVVTESRLVMPDGRLCWTRWTQRGFFDEKGDIVEYQSVGRDITELKAVEDALTASEDKFRSMVEKSADWIWEIDLSGIHTFSNRNVIEILGISAEKFIGQDAFSLLHDEDRVKVQMELPSLIAAKRGWREWVLRWRHKDGSYRYLESNADPVLDSTGELRGYRGIDRDITARIKNEALLRESEERFKTVLQDVHSIAVQGYGPDGTTRYWNKASEVLYGYSAKEAIGRNLIDLIIPPEMQNDVKQAIQSMAESGQPIPPSELNLLRKDGSLVPVFSNHVIIKIPEYDQELFCLDIDLTELKQAETNLASSERFLKTIIDTEPECIKLLDADCNILMMNPAGLAMIEADSLEQVEGQCLCPLITEPYRDTFIALTKQVFQGKPGTVEFETIGLKGRHFWLETHAVPFRNEAGEIESLLAITRDITERKKAEDERLIFERQLLQAQKLESLGVLAGGIAHDFNNILTAIMGNISYARMDLDASQHAHEPLARAERAVKRAAALAKQLLVFSTGGNPVKKMISIRQSVNEAVSLVLSGSSVEAIIDLPADLHTVNADEGLLSQALNNIIINAVQAMPAGGKLTVTAKNSAIAEGNSLGLPAGDYVEISFTDEGCGIAAEDMGKIFDPYFTNKTGGSGLGLTSTYAIINKHGGHISVSSLPDMGTTFTILIPGYSEPVNEEMNEIHTSDEAQRGYSILVMDDDEMVRDLAKITLQRYDYTVVCCDNGAAAVSLYRSARAEGEPFSLVIMDLTIPGGMGGIEAARQILAFDPEAHLIVSSGYSEDPVMANFSDYGFCAALEKPYNVEEINRTLHKVKQG